jgi:hypothetical protein
MVVVGYCVGRTVAIDRSYFVCVFLEALEREDNWSYWFRGCLARELRLGIVDR